jgi:hypothetical protein
VFTSPIFLGVPDFYVTLGPSKIGTAPPERDSSLLIEFTAVNVIAEPLKAG